MRVCVWRQGTRVTPNSERGLRDHIKWPRCLKRKSRVKGRNEAKLFYTPGFRFIINSAFSRKFNLSREKGSLFWFADTFSCVSLTEDRYCDKDENEKWYGSCGNERTRLQFLINIDYRNKIASENRKRILNRQFFFPFSSLLPLRANSFLWMYVCM